MDEDEREYQDARKRVHEWFRAQVTFAGTPVKIGERRKRSFGEMPPPPIPDPVILYKPAIRSVADAARAERFPVTTRTEMPRP